MALPVIPARILLLAPDSNEVAQLDQAINLINTAKNNSRLPVTLVWIGSNDLWEVYEWKCNIESPQDCADEDLKGFSDNIETILDRLTATGSIVLIALLDDHSKRPVVSDPKYSDSRAEITVEELPLLSAQTSRYNTAIEDLAARYGATVVDIYNTTIFQESVTVSAEDGDHPNHVGYDQLAEIWYDSLSSTLTAWNDSNTEFLPSPVVSVSTDNMMVTISWTSDERSTGNMLFYAPYPAAEYIGQMDMGAGTNLTFEAPPGTAFYVAVQAYAGEVVSEFSNIEYFVVLDQNNEDQFHDIALKSSITKVQPMTGIVFWPDNDQNETDVIQLEFSYVLYNQVVRDSGVYDWTFIDNLLDEIANRNHQAILRFRFVYPGYETSVPDYIKNLSDYHETKGISEGLYTWFPDWANSELQRFVLEFYTKFGEKYENDPRLAFLQTGFGLWAEYHIYDGPFELGNTFPSKAFQGSFFTHLNTALQNIPWSISIDAASESYSPFSENRDLLNIHFGLFDDSFMHENHFQENALNWQFFDLERYLISPAGGEFSYYLDFDQENVLNEEGIYGVTYEEAAAQFHISYMIGNDQPDYQTMERIKEAGVASGYKFEIVSFKASQDSSVVEIKNSGIAPFYYDAYACVNGVRSKESLKLLAPGKSLVCNISSGGMDPVLTIESDHLLQGQTIEYKANMRRCGQNQVKTLVCP